MTEKNDIPLGPLNVNAGGELLAKKQFELGVVPQGGFDSSAQLRLVHTGETFSTLPANIAPLFFANIEFTRHFVPTNLFPKLRPTKLVVVSQDPDPDMFLPAGTPVDLVMALKEDLPVESFSNIHSAVLEKYSSVGAVIEDLNKAGDTRAEAARRVLEEPSQVKYEALSPQASQAVNAFIQERFNINADVPAEKEKAAKVFENLRFLNSF